MTTKVPMRVTVTFVYEANPANYPSGVPHLMALVDRSNFEDDTGTLLEEIASNVLSITVEPVDA